MSHRYSFKFGIGESVWVVTGSWPSAEDPFGTGFEVWQGVVFGVHHDQLGKWLEVGRQREHVDCTRCFATEVEAQALCDRYNAYIETLKGDR